MSTPILFENPANRFEYPMDEVWFQPKVRIHDKGLLFTGNEDGQPVTMFVDQRNRENRVPGRLFMISGDYATKCACCSAIMFTPRNYINNMGYLILLTM